MTERVAGRDQAVEFLKDAVRGALIQAGIGLLGARIDQLADITIDAVIDHPTIVKLAVGMKLCDDRCGEHYDGKHWS